MSGTLGITGEAFWTATDVEESAGAGLSARGFLGLCIDGPRHVYLDAHTTLPIFGVFSVSAADAMRVELKREAVLVAVHEETNQVVAARPFKIDKDVPSAPVELEPDPEVNLEGASVRSSFRLELPAALRDFQLRPGHLRLTMLRFDERSNTTVSEVAETEVTDPEVKAFIAARRKVGWPRPASPEPKPDVASYRRDAQSPAAPAEVGITLATERVVVDDDARKVVVRGAFRLPLKRGDVVRPAPVDPKTNEILWDSGWMDVDDPDAKAVVPITLVLTGDKYPHPWTLDLQVPVYAVTEGDAPMAEGTFAVDLTRVRNPLVRAQTYAIYAVSRTVLAGPIKVALIPPSLLPQAE